MQAGAARDLERLARERLSQADLAFDSIRAFAGSRRLTLVVEGLPAGQNARMDLRKGPRSGAAEAAIAGFVRASGIDRGALIERDGAYWAERVEPGRPMADILAQMVPEMVAAFPWPKSMTSAGGSLRWVRPLRRVLCIFDRKLVPFSLDGLESGDLSEGHRAMGARMPFRARDFGEYREALAGHFVVLDVEERKRRILQGADRLCAERGLRLVRDEGLLTEVAGMVEWPTPLLGSMDPDYLSLPPEVIRTSMRVHQRYFAVCEGDAGALAPFFIAVANIEAADNGLLIAAGNARVLAARLADARYFWDEDCRRSLESRIETLAGVTFHARLGDLQARALRIGALARDLACFSGADPELAAHAGRLAKADLVTAMVGEFPELQGVMGGYYARAEGIDAQVADAIADHYRPQGPGEAPPTAPVSMAVALADKIDMILGFFSIDETPTGSRDPFALRRAALGVIRTILDARLRAPIREMARLSEFATPEVIATVVDFFHERLKALLRDQGARVDLIDAVFALDDDDLTRVVERIDALQRFLETPDGANLVSGYKRAANILSAEARKGPLPTGAPDRAGAPGAEAGLFDALSAVRPVVVAALASDDYVAALGALAELRAPVDVFFDQVLVNSNLATERDNRLRLLRQIDDVMGAVADFSRVSG